MPVYVVNLGQTKQCFTGNLCVVEKKEANLWHAWDMFHIVRIFEKKMQKGDECLNNSSSKF